MCFSPRRDLTWLDWNLGWLRCANAADELHSIEINRPPKWHIIFSRILRLPKQERTISLRCAFEWVFFPILLDETHRSIPPINKGRGGWVQKEQVGGRRACVFCSFLSRTDSVISVGNTCFTWVLWNVKNYLCGKVVCCWRGERVPVISQGGTWFTECLKRKVIEVEPGLERFVELKWTPPIGRIIHDIWYFWASTFPPIPRQPT